MFRRFSATSVADEHNIVDDFIRGYSKELRKHGYPNDNSFNIFNETLISKIINKFLKNADPKSAYKLLNAFNGPELLKLIVAVHVEPLTPNLLDFAKVYSYLNDASLRYVAIAFKAEVFEQQLPYFNPTDSDSMLAAIFVRKIKVIQTQMRLAQAWSIRHTYISGSEIELGESDNELQATELRIISNYIEEHKMPELTAQILDKQQLLTKNELEKILTISLSDLRRVDYEEPNHGDENQKFLEDSSKPRYIIMNFFHNNIGHAVAIAFWKDKICIVNRGGLSKPGNDGLRLYSVEPVIREKLLNIASRSTSGDVIFSEEKVIEYIQENSKFLYHMPMSQQSAQNCVWVAAKSLSWAAVYFNTLQVMAENNKSVNYDVAKDVATIVYKFLTKQIKINTLRDYLVLNSEERGDPNLLAGVYIKIRNAKWGQELSELIPKFSPGSLEASDKLLQKQFNDAVKFGFEKTVKKLLPIVKTTALDTRGPFQLALLNAAANIGNEYFERQFKVLQLLIDSGINETSLKYASKEFSSINALVEYVIEKHSSILSDGVDIQQNKEKLLQLLETINVPRSSASVGLNRF